MNSILELPDLSLLQAIDLLPESDLVKLNNIRIFDKLIQRLMLI